MRSRSVGEMIHGIEACANERGALFANSRTQSVDQAD